MMWYYLNVHFQGQWVRVKTLSCILVNMVNSVPLLSIWLQETLYQLTFTNTWSCLWDDNSLFVAASATSHHVVLLLPPHTAW